MSTELLEQLQIYGEDFDAGLTPVTLDDLENVLLKPVGTGAVRPLQHRQSQTGPLRGWAYALATAAAVLVLVGGVALLLQVTGPDAPVADTVVPTTSDTTAPPTTLPTAPDLGLLPDTGPRLNFVSAEPPSGSKLNNGVWFKDALYAVGWSDPDAPLQLYRSVDGLNWELVSGAASILAGVTNDLPVLGSDGDRIVSVGLGSDCFSRGDFLSVSVSLNGTDWSSSQIEPPIPGSSNSAGCYSVEIGDLAVGVHGIVVTATVEQQGGLPPRVVEFRPEEGVMVVEHDGEIIEIDLDATSFSADINPNWDVDEMIAVFTNPDSFYRSDPESFSRSARTFSWWSADGQNWQTTEPSLADVVATADGFTGRARIGAELPREWTSEDGTTWTNTGVMMLHHNLAVFPDGRIVTTGTYGIRAIDDPNTAIIGATGTNGLNVQIGEFGLIGTAALRSPASRTVLFSDGTTWSRWVPPAFESVSEPSELVLVGIGDEFVVLRQVGSQVGSQLDLLWVGTLP